MPDIRILDDDTINKIAAGEVIERPASVVKELVENSLDAAASEIIIKISDAGKKLIQVVDDGCGMSADDAKLAFERHATSKIIGIADLDSIKTMGFRGEALSSIASVAEVFISTRAAPSKTGISILLKNGKPVRTKEKGMEKGTSVEVRNLFANIPARAKFLKGDRVEFSHIIKMVTERALANPNVAFRLYNDDVEVINYPASDKLAHRFLDVFGRKAARVAVKVEGQGISGLVAKPEVTKPGSGDLHIFVNSRPVTNKKLRDAVESGYDGMLMRGRHAIGVIFIEIDPGQVDVNVHPTKREIKFADIKSVMRSITASVSSALGNVEHVPEYNSKPFFGEGRVRKPKKPVVEHENSAAQSHLMEDENSEMSVEDEVILGKMRPVGQIMNTYIIAQSGKDLAIIDQHAAHERVMLEKVRSGHKKAEQKLITPLPLEVSKREFELLQHYRPLLEEQGFTIEPFGRSTFLVRAVPVFSGRLEDPENLMELVHELAELGKAKSLESRRDDIRNLVACHSAIRAGEGLDMRQMKRLIHELHGLDNPYTCAHGRPTIIKITERELEKMFKRGV